MLSILICSLTERQKKLEALLNALELQRNSMVDIDVLVDNREMSIGKKRSILLSRAKRKYAAFIDDDDMVDNGYVGLILSAIQSGNFPDCIGIVGQMVGGPSNGWTFRHSITVGRWFRDKHRHIYFRTPNHLNPIKAEIASSIGFPDISWGEDKAFSDNVRGLLKTEEFIEHPIYFYQKDK
jgi:hypothetical protein